MISRLLQLVRGVLPAIGSRNYLAKARLLLTTNEVYIDLDRVQYEERLERRATLERELSGIDTQQCFERVRRRMTLGDSVWIPPYYNVEHSYREWRHRHRSRRLAQVTPIREERKA